MENWKTHFLSFIVLSGFMIVALASEDDAFNVEGSQCSDASLMIYEPAMANDAHTVTYQVRIIDKVTSEPLSNMTVGVDVLVYNCTELEACPFKCLMRSRYLNSGTFIGLTDGNGAVSQTTGQWKADSKKDRMKLVIVVKDENLLEYAYKRKDVLIGPEETNVSITIPVIKNLQ